MDLPKDPTTIAMAAILGLGGGAATQLLDVGKMDERLASCERQNTKQWEKIGELKERVKSLEIFNEVLHP